MNISSTDLMTRPASGQYDSDLAPNDLTLRSARLAEFENQTDEELILYFKTRILKAARQAGKLGLVAHIPSAFSIIEILWALYRYDLTIDPDEQTKDRFILSKGHGSLALYVILDQLNICEQFREQEFLSFGGLFGGIPHPSKIRGIEFSGGSLGHGLPVAVGIALGYKIKCNPHKVYTLVGDGEMHEGTNWEAFMIGATRGLDNLCCIIENNKTNEGSVSTESLCDKVKSFGWICLEVDGHDISALRETFAFQSKGKPVCIIANTVKGNGIPEFQDKIGFWHTQVLSEEYYQKFLGDVHQCKLEKTDD